ncbi:MAG: peptide chain release factor N(5)-glutamine methyltransferase [Polaromonas sp.]|nr:peptide chain release factor N(5)-glutamine methyltransferase [Polaromonas sp.]
MAGAVSHAAGLAQALAAGLDRLDAHLLLLRALERPASDRAWLVAHDDDAMTAAVACDFAELCRRRAAGEPLAYLVGSKEFFGLALQVDARVLIPRPDTETLVRWALERLQVWRPARASGRSQSGSESSSESGSVADAGPRVLDLGCGSGAIALAIAANLPQAWPATRIVATDASAAALELAQQNWGRLRQPEWPTVDFLQGDWLEPVVGTFDLIVSNPPYIANADPHLDALAHEPISALTAGSAGMDDLQKIVAAAPAHLRRGGWLLLEHGHDQAGPVQQLLRQHGFAEVQSRRDLCGISRCAGGSWPGSSGGGPGVLSTRPYKV